MKYREILAKPTIASSLDTPTYEWGTTEEEKIKHAESVLRGERGYWLKDFNHSDVKWVWVGRPWDIP